MINIYLDDVREAPEGWVRVYSVSELIKLIKDRNDIGKLSLDHDLGEEMQTGYDFMRWLEAEVFGNRIRKIPEIVFHTSNPVGRAKMQQVLDSIQRILGSRHVE